MIRAQVIRALRIPPLPVPGDGEILVRPSPRQSWIEIAAWSLRQVGAVFGILLSIAFLRGIELPLPFFSISQQVFARIERALSSAVPDLLPGPWELTSHQLLWILEGLAVTTFLVQLVVSGALLKLKLAHRAYLVSDEQLRLRDGILTVREQSFTVANIQNMVVRQGPLQSLLGIADLEISTAGGGEHDDNDDKPSLHLGRLRSLEEAGLIRDRLRAAQQRHRHSGLGGLANSAAREQAFGEATDSTQLLLAAASDLLAATRELAGRIADEEGVRTGA